MSDFKGMITSTESKSEAQKAQAAATQRLYFIHFDLAGFSYYDGALVFDQLHIGSQLHLQYERDNPHDEHAVAVYFDSINSECRTKLGYVPSQHNKTIAKLCQMGYADIFDVRVVRVNAGAHPERQISVTVHLLPR